MSLRCKDCGLPFRFNKNQTHPICLCDDAGQQQVSVEANENPYEELFWQMLRYLEVHTKPEDILIRRDIEDGYKLWNKLHNTNMEPRWRKGLD